MATIVFLDPDDEFAGSIRGLTFDKSQAGAYVKKRPAPVNHQTNRREKTWALIRQAQTFYWAMNMGQKLAWSSWGLTMGITGPYGSGGVQRGYPAFFSVMLNAMIAGDPIYTVPPPPIPLAGVTVTAITRFSDTNIRIQFNPSPAGANNRIFLRQAIPGPGVKRWSKVDGYIASYSRVNPTSPLILTTRFPHLAGWNGRYWTGTQETTGRRSPEVLWDI